MPENDMTIHLSTLLGRLRNHKAKKKVKFYDAVIQRAALLAKNDTYRGRVELEAYPGWMFDLESAEKTGDWSVVGRIDQGRLDRGEEALDRTELKKAVLREFAAQEEMLDAIKDGKLRLLNWSRPGVYSCFDVDLSVLEQPRYVTINRQFDTAINEISEEQDERRGYDGSVCLLWEDIVQEIIKKIKAPCNETLLNYYADRVCLGDLPQSDGLTIAIADLHDRGFVEQWFKRIWQKYPNEAQEAELPKVAERASGALGTSGKTWKEVQKAAEQYVKRNKNVFPGVNALAQIIDCSPATILKATTKSKYLTARKAEHENRPKKPRVVPLTTTILETTPLQSESEPREIELARLKQEQADDRNRDARQHTKWQHTRTPPD